MKFLIIGCYKLADGYKAMSNGLRYLGHDISFFPIFAAQDFLKDNKDYNIENEILRAVNGLDLTINFENYINICRNKCDYIILWHGVDMCAKYHQLLKNIKLKTNVKLIQLNWDPNHIFKDSLNIYYKDFNYIFSVNGNITKYLNNELKFKNAYHFYQAFDENYSFYKKDDNYKCDISILCTNLYTHNMWKDKIIDRKKLLDILYADKSINLHIYGPDFLNKLYPNAYKGYISYDKSYLVFSNSLINLNISPVGDTLTTKINSKNEYYFSERLPQILICKGLMVCDQNFEDFLKEDKDYIRLKKEEDIINIINDVKKNPKKYDTIRNNGYNVAFNNINCYKFGEYISKRITF